MSFIQNLFTSRDNNANSATYVGQQDRLWWDPVTNQFYYSDGSTPGGFPVGVGNVGGGNITIQNQGNTLTSALNTMNFTGNGVVATNVGNVVTVNITAGSGSGLPPVTGNVGKILGTDGVNPLWQYMPGVFGLVIDGGDAAFASLDFIIDGGPA